MQTQPGWTWLPGKRAWEHCPWILRLPRAPPSPHSPLQPQLKACGDCVTFTQEHREVPSSPFKAPSLAQYGQSSLHYLCGNVLQCHVLYATAEGLRLREVNRLAGGHTAGKRQSKAWDSGFCSDPWRTLPHTAAGPGAQQWHLEAWVQLPAESLSLCGSLAS